MAEKGDQKMAYDPTAPTESERSGAYFLIWPGAVGSAVLLLAQFVALPRAFSGFATLAIATSLLVAILSSRNDVYFRHLADVSSKFAMGVVALWFCAAAIIYTGQGGHILGELAAGARPLQFNTGRAFNWFNGETITVAVALAFHVRFLIGQYRG
jgi:hypothetical protein